VVDQHLDKDGNIINPKRADWKAGSAFVTPPGYWHSHHNESGAPAHLIPIQDALAAPGRPAAKESSPMPRPLTSVRLAAPAFVPGPGLVPEASLAADRFDYSPRPSRSRAMRCGSTARRTCSADSYGR
jgi:hypothetical protein